MIRGMFAGVALYALAGLAGADAPTWEVRLAQLPDQTDEWTAQGRVPGWEIAIGEGPAPEVRIAGDEQGAFRGIVLVGRRWTVPDPAPAMLQFALDYETYCASDEPPYERSGAMSLGLFTVERWEQFATEPVQAQTWSPGAPDEGVLALAQVHPNGQDVTEWRAWHSGRQRMALGDYAGQEVVLAVVWSAYHFVEEWAAFRGLEVSAVTDAELERTFLERIDADCPGLEGFARTMAAGDLEAAKQAFIEHMRTRSDPPGPELASDASPALIERADEVLAHTFRLASCPPTTLEWPIRWSEDPHEYDQWPIALNRHSEWVTLSRAYATTGDESYAREFVALLRSWLDAMPVNIGPRYAEGPFFVAGRSPLTLDAGIRMAQTWWPAYYHFRASPSFDADTQLRMVRSFVDHADYLMNPEYFHVSSNWGAMEANGLFHIAVMLPEMRDSRVWLDTARERLQALLAAQVYPDGAQMELTPGYHWVTLSNLLGSLSLARRTGTELPAELETGLENMFEYFAAIALPDGSVPNVNDSGRSRVEPILRQGLALFPARSDFEYVMTQGRSGEAPAQASWHLPWAGWSLMRTGWGPQDRCLFFESGPFGAAHQHEDKLNLIVQVAGHTALAEAGTYSYDRSAWRQYVLSTRAHNTVMVDGLEQNRRARPETRVAEEPADARWFSDDHFDFARGVYDSGYGPDNAVEVTHERQVLFVKPDYWIVCDLMTPADGGEHTYEAIFHLDGGSPRVDGETGAVTVFFDGAAFSVTPVGPVIPDISLVEGQTEPAVQGWLPTGRHNELRPIPTPIFRWRATGPSAMAFVLAPREAEGEWPVTSLEALEAGTNALAFAALRADGGRDVFVRSWGGEVTVPNVCTTDADAALVRLAPDGSPRAVFQSGGSGVELLAPR